MSKTNIITILSIALFMGVLSPVIANLLQNPSFETWTSPTQPANWIVESLPFAQVFKESTTVFHGLYSAKLRRLQVGSGNNYGLKQQVTIPGRGRYIARVRFFDNTDSVSGGFLVTWRTAAGGFISSWGTLYTTNSPSWQLLQRNATSDTAPSGAGLADFLIRTYGSSTTPAGGTFFVDSVSFVQVTGIEENEVSNSIKSLRLEITPNPFSNFTKINFTVDPALFRSIKIYDATGNIIKTITEPNFTNGAFFTTWDGRNMSGKLVAPGVYFIALETNQTETKVVKSLFLR